MDPLTIRRAALRALHADPANARSHDERNLDAIEGSLRQFGQAEPLVVQRSTGKVIGGNGRMTAMKALGWTECDVVELDLDDTQATALGIALNRTGELAEGDLPALTKILESFKGTDTSDSLGFDEKELNAMLDEVIAAGQSLDGIVEDGAPALPDAATTRARDLWVLGAHRLLCGDSSKADDVQRLPGGARIQLVSMDPPYNVKDEPHSYSAGLARPCGPSSGPTPTAYAASNHSRPTSAWPRRARSRSFLERDMALHGVGAVAG